MAKFYHLVNRNMLNLYFEDMAEEICSNSIKDNETILMSESGSALVEVISNKNISEIMDKWYKDQDD